MIRVAIALTSGAAAVVAARGARTAAVRTRLRELRRSPRRLPTAVRAPVAAALQRTGTRVDPEPIVQGWATFTLAALVLAGISAPPLLPVVAGGAIVAPLVLARVLRRRVDRRVEAALPETIRLIAADLRGGGTVRSALERIAAQSSPLAGDFRRVVTRVNLGDSLPSALARWVDDRPIPGSRAFAGALVLAADLGGGSASALEGLAVSVADRQAITGELRAQSAQARASAIVVAIAPLGYLVLMAAVDRDAAGALVATSVGRWCAGVGIALDLAAVMWMRRIVRDPAPAW
jgi:tight adherence protein B